jgi:diketogulonate reductase-like aldo/keto reductase
MTVHSEAMSRSGWRELRGVAFPPFLYGTAWKEERTEELTELALRAGFAGIDTANQRKHYVEAAVGAAVEKRGARGDLFLQTKFTFEPGQDHRLPYDAKAGVETQVAQSFESSLQHLRSGYIDSYVLHGPSSRSGLRSDDWAAWRAMEALQRSGKARLLGVSNVSLQQLELLVQGAAIKPAFVQNRCYARLGWDGAVRAFCAAHDMVYQGFSLLTANRAELGRAAVSQLSQRTGRSVPELVFRFALEVGMLPLTGTSNPEHMRLDLGCLDFELAPADVATLEQIAA